MNTNTPSPSLSSILHTPGTLTLQGNLPLTTAHDAGRVTCRRLATGHLVCDGPLGRRVLLTDPDGHPLHECDWRERPDGTVYLASARFRLDWGQWVGLKPGELVHATTLDLTTRRGWQTLTRQDLRVMAARAMRVALEDVAFFYVDDDLVIESTGHAVIRQRKDALYVLDDGAFASARFMSCLSAMHWARIDYLPVVELFQSLLPGTGSAAFEFIRGLYDDQNPGAPRPLRYRGIPTYPSPAAFSLFSNFFTPTHPGTERPLDVFMDAARSREVEWRPVPHPPVRYVAPRHRLCLTVAHGVARKATRLDDTSGLPFVPPTPQGFAPGNKRLTVRASRLHLDDHTASHTIPLEPGWGITHDTEPAPSPPPPSPSGKGIQTAAGAVGTSPTHPSPFGRGIQGEGTPLETKPPPDPGTSPKPVPSPDPGTSPKPGTPPETGSRHEPSWEDMFPDGTPAVSPREATCAVLLYPDDATVIGDLESQPFVVDFWHDLAQAAPATRLQPAHALIHGFDACIAALPIFDAHSVTALYTHGAHAQKQAQALWNRSARRQATTIPPASTAPPPQAAPPAPVVSPSAPVVSPAPAVSPPTPTVPPPRTVYRFVPDTTGIDAAYRVTYDLLYVWVPFAEYDRAATLRARLRRIDKVLQHNGLAYLAGPDSLPSFMDDLALEVTGREQASALPPFRQHQSILPQATLHPRLHAWTLRKR